MPSTQPHSSKLIALEAIPPHTPLLGISSTIHSTPGPGPLTTLITLYHYSDALTSPPLLGLMLCTAELLPIDPPHPRTPITPQTVPLCLPQDPTLRITQDSPTL